MNNKALSVVGLQPAEAKRNVYRATVAADDTPETILDPKWWVHVAARLRLDDRVELIAPDRSWYGEVTILEVGKSGHGGARVAFIVGPVLLRNDAVVAKQADLAVRWNGSAKWEVYRTADKLVLKSGFDTKEQAAAWLVDPAAADPAKAAA